MAAILGYDVCTLSWSRGACLIWGLQLSCQTKIISVCPDVPLCSNNRSKGKLGITYHRFSVDKYAKESWIVRIRRDVGKNFQVSDCGLRLQAKQALSVVNLFKVTWSTRIMCRAELLFYFVPMYFYCRNKPLQLFFRFQEAKNAKVCSEYLKPSTDFRTTFSGIRV